MIKVSANFADLSQKKFRHTHGWIYEELSILNAKKVLYYSVFYIRRALYVLILVYDFELPSVQLFLHLNLCVLTLIYNAGQNPFISKQMNKIEVLNEFSVILSSYHYFFFLDGRNSIEARFIMGYSLVGVLAI